MKNKALNVLSDKKKVVIGKEGGDTKTRQPHNNCVSFYNDVFFKYSLIGEDASSRLLRNFFCQIGVGDDFTVVSTTVLNAEILPDQFGDKRIVMDVLAEDELGRKYNIEMQKSFANSDFNRWEFYGARNLSVQGKAGSEYQDFQPVYQIIITFFEGEANKRNPKLINRYVMRNEDGIKEQEHALINRTYINLNVIDKIVKEKGLENLNEFESLCYMYKYNQVCDKIDVGRLVNAVMEKYDEMKANNGVWTLAEKIEEYKYREQLIQQEKWEEGLKEGLKKGKEEGMLLGVIEMVKQLILKKYGRDANEWLASLSKQQLDEIAQLILTCDTIEELQQQVNEHI